MKKAVVLLLLPYILFDFGYFLLERTLFGDWRINALRPFYEIWELFDCDAALGVLDDELATQRRIARAFNLVADYVSAYKEAGKGRECATALQIAEALVSKGEKAA